MIKKTQLSSLVCASLLASSAPVLAQEVNWSIETGLGYESNVFHAPDHDYIDSALPSLRPWAVNGLAVSPVEKDGLFIPVDVQVEMRNKIDKRSNLLTEIGLDTKVMLDSDLSDATSTDVDFEIGYEHIFTKKYKGKKRKKVGDTYIGGFVSTHSQVYVDKDTGLPKTDTGGVSLSDKYSYQSVGIKGEYERKHKKMKYKAGFVIENLNYDAPQTGAEYDHTLNEIILGVAREFSKSTDLSLKYSHAVRDYDKRYARDAATGTYDSALNDLLEYTYDSIDMTLGQKVGDNLKLYLDLDFTTRTDAFEGYNDYSKTDVAVRVRYNYSEATKIRVKLASSSTDYDKAFNFEDNTRGFKENSGFDLDLKVEHEWSKNKLYYVELNHTDRVSTDDRYDYTNNEVMIGAKWEY